MTERSFFNFDSQPEGFDRLDPTPWELRLQDLTHSIEPHDDDQVVEATFDEESLPTHSEIIELIETLHSGESNPFVAKPLPDRCHSIHLPQHYEPRYAYPLIVWFHGEGSSEQELPGIMDQISDRNFIGLAIRGNVVQDNGFAWSNDAASIDTLVNDVESIVLSLRRQYHIHSERIYLAGFGSGASTAMELIIRKPEWFGGAACICGSYSKLKLPSFRLGEFRNKRILLGTTGADRSRNVRDTVNAGHLLFSSGIKIGTRFYQDSVKTPTAKMLGDINHWLMDDVCSPVT